MCHDEAPAVRANPPARRTDVLIPATGGDRMPAFLSGPDQDGPGALVLADVFGPNEFYLDLSARLANAGYHTLLPDIFFRLEKPADASREAVFGRRRQLNDRQAVLDQIHAIEWLAAQPGVHGVRIATIGFCMGGTFALNLAAERQNLVTVCYYGFPRPHSTGLDPMPAPADQVDRLRGPIIGFWGAEDESVGIDNVAAYARDCAAATVELEHHIYPGLAHGFLGRALTDPDHPGHRSAAESWHRTLTFLDHHLKGPESGVESHDHRRL